MTETTGYEDLSAILVEAFKRSAGGRAKEVCGRDIPFDRQPINEIGRMLRAPEGAMFHAVEEIQKAAVLCQRGQFDAADLAMLDAIVYTAAAIKLNRELAHINAERMVDEGFKNLVAGTDIFS